MMNFVLTNNVLREYDDMEGKIKSLKPLTIYRRF